MNAPLLALPAPTLQAWSRMDTVPRYYITPELWDTFSEEQIDKQIKRLIETGRLPTLPEDFTIRLHVDSVLDTLDLYVDGTMNEGEADHFFLDFHFKDHTFICATRIVRWQTRYAHVPLYAREKLCRQSMIDRENHDRAAAYGERPLAAWFDGNAFLVRETMNSLQRHNAYVAREAFRVLAIVLQDRTIHKVEIEPRKPLSRIARKLAARRGPQDPAPEIILHVPARFYTGEHGGTHASPRLHYRAEHDRRQAVGPRGAGGHKLIVIEGMWINAEDIDPKELGTPLRKYRLTT